MSGAIAADELQATILVVDDKKDTREAIAAYMQFEGYEVRECEDGVRALATIQEIAPDLVLLDGMMPGLDGVDVLRTLRETPQTAQLPVIMVTARGDTSDVARALKAGADDYMIKPVQLEVLANRVRAILRLRILEAQRRSLRERLERLHDLADLTLQETAVEGSEPAQRAAEEMRAVIAVLLQLTADDQHAPV